MFDMPIQQGWQCPVCKRVYAPNTPMCVYCPTQVIITTGTGTPPPDLGHTICKCGNAGCGMTSHDTQQFSIFSNEKE